MGIIKTTIKLSNPRFPEIETLEVECLVDTGALHLCITEAQAIQLKLEEFDKRPVTITDSSIRQLPYVGPLKVDWRGRVSFTGAMIPGSQCLLGAIPMEDIPASVAY